MYFRIMEILASIIVLIFLNLACEGNSSVSLDIKTVKDTKKIEICQDGMVCREDSDCFDGVCKQGVCKCSSSNFCQNDEDCGENKCCNIMTGTCYDCVKDTDIEVDSYNDIAVDTIVDIDDAQADIEDNGVVECKKDLDCPLDKFHCHPEKLICVECYKDEHCSIGTCDTQRDICIKPVEDIGIDIDLDVQSDGATDVFTDTGADIVADTGDPCLDYVCLCGTICVLENGNPNCKNGCKVDKDCCANTVCKNGQCEKTSCTEDIDCKDSSKPHCEPISGLCYECTNDLHCQSNYYCDANHTCKYKVDECYGTCDPNKQWCNPVKKQCEDIPSNWCVTCSQVLDPLCIMDGLTCGTLTKRCTKQCNDNSECFGYTCNPFGWCTCP